MKATSTGSLSFVPIFGRWEVRDDEVRYLAPQPEVGVPVGICLTSARLADGTVSVNVKGGDNREHGRVLLGYRSESERYLMVGLGGHGFGYTIAELRPGVGWQPLAHAGSPENLLRERSYGIKAQITGQRIQLTVDNVRVLDHVLEEELALGQVGFFAWGDAAVSFAGVGIASRPRTVFVVMQFSDRYGQIFERVVRPVASDFNLRAYHAGEIFGPGQILKDIVQGIADARVIVADITPANQNVFYELGYAHALGKAVILLAERGKDLPFDLRGYRVLFYEPSAEGQQALADGLRRHFHAILDPDDA